jgi:hypothetical protein
MKEFEHVTRLLPQMRRKIAAGDEIKFYGSNGARFMLRGKDPRIGRVS